MKTRSLFVLSLLFIGSVTTVQAETNSVPHKAHHLVVVWLKQHGDVAVRKQYIEASKRLAKLPGVLTYHIGIPAAIKRDNPRPALDDSFDIAISSTFENLQALENYSKHAEHQKVIQETLKPLVEKYKVYDFVE